MGLGHNIVHYDWLGKAKPKIKPLHKIDMKFFKVSHLTEFSTYSLND